MNAPAPVVLRPPAGLYDVGDGWLHRIHPLTKLASVFPVTALAVCLPLPYAALTLGVVAVAVVTSKGLGVVLRSCLLLVPVGAALVVLHAVLSHEKGEAVLGLGPVVIGGDGLLSAATILVRLAAFVLTVGAVMGTTHPKVLATALNERGVSHKFTYAYLAGAELLPEMRGRARAILDSQRSRGFDPGWSVARRMKGLGLLLKPLLLGAVISAETRALALDSRGFAITGKRTSTAPVPKAGDSRLARVSLLLLGVAIIIGRAAQWLILG